VKKLFWVVLACASLVLGCANLQQHLEWASYPGALKRGRCAQYAVSVVTDLHRRHVESYYVEYEWATKKESGAHAVAIFRDAGGGLSIVDNERPFPRPLRPAKSVLELIQQNCPEAKHVRGSPEIKL